MEQDDYQIEGQVDEHIEDLIENQIEEQNRCQPKKQIKPVTKREVIFMGRSNVGKSTTIRALTGRNVRVGKKPGVTLKPINLEFSGLLVTDMPGFGYMTKLTKADQERIKENIIRYVEDNAERIICAVLVLDSKMFSQVVDRWEGRNEHPIDVEMFEFLYDVDIDIIVAANKMDKTKEDQDIVLDGIAERLGMLPPWRQWLDRIAPITAKKGDVSALYNLISDRLHNIGKDEWITHFKKSQPNGNKR